MLQAILFDLDGTLLPMNNEQFTKAYFHALARSAYGWGYTDSELLVNAIKAGLKAMVKNQGEHSNNHAFWDAFSQIMGDKCREDIPKFDRFYENEFHNIRDITSPNTYALETIKLAREKAQKVILATNAVFPLCAMATRMSWVGLKPDDFDYVTDYDNSYYCKPNPDYYKSILEKHSLDASQCLMIGNDVQEDIEPTMSIGMSAYLLSDNIINRKDSMPDCPQGNYQNMLEYLRKL